ncbi:MAG: hypothetical protein H6754_02100 [Candidatus Omnitrophica bacterium]|nr:hypothetical protein [Candidatus Omnitrophota bacterium]
MNPYQPSYDDFNTTSTVTKSMPNLDWNTLVVDPLMNLVSQCIAFIPDLIAALYILAFAWLIGKLLEFVVSSFLKAIRFDVIADKIGLNDLINSQKGAAMSPSKWFGIITFWLTICIALVMALNRLRLNMASKWLDDMVTLLISIFAAVTILTLGIFLSEIVSRIVHTGAQKLGVQRGALYSGFIRYAVLFFTLMLTLMQFHIPGQFVLIAVGAIFATLCVTFVIAFGFGGSAWAAKVLDKFY